MGNDNITRREFVKLLAAGSVVAASPDLSRATSQRDYILVGNPDPFTGPLADFGEATKWTLGRLVDHINADGGIFLKDLGKKLPLQIKTLDTASDPARAADCATRLILHDHVDLMLVMHTPDTVNPVSAICERYETPCVSLDAPVEAWLPGGPYKWCYHSFWTVDSLIDVYMGIWEQHAAATSRVVGGFWPNDADGEEWSKIFRKKLVPRGYTLIDSPKFPHLTRDYGSIINQFKKEKVEIVTGVMIPPDWALAWRQCRQYGFTPKIATMGKAILFPSAVNAIGRDLGVGLSCEVWWSEYHPFKSSLTDESAKDLCSAWTKETGRQWTQPIGFKHAGVEIIRDVLTRAGGLDKSKILQALQSTDLNTIVGPIRFNDLHYAETPLVGGQWKRETVGRASWR